jgi:hypothetical protein
MENPTSVQPVEILGILDIDAPINYSRVHRLVDGN